MADVLAALRQLEETLKPSSGQPRRDEASKVPPFAGVTAPRRFSQSMKRENSSEYRQNAPFEKFPLFVSSLPYTTVRDFAYSIMHPMHYGPPPPQFDDRFPRREYTVQDHGSEPDVSSLASSTGLTPHDESRYSPDNRSSIAPPDEEMRGQAVALFDFERENENELPLVEGQTVLVTYRQSGGWLVAEDPQTGESGLVPEEYVRLLRDIHGGGNGSGQSNVQLPGPVAADVGPLAQPEHSQIVGHPSASSHKSNDYQQATVSSFSIPSEDLWKPRRLSDVSEDNQRTTTSGSIFVEQNHPRSPLDPTAPSTVTQKVVGDDSKIKYSEPEVDSEEFPTLESPFIVGKQKSNPRPETLSRMLSEGDVGTVKWILENHFELVAKDNFDWIGDLKEAGCSNDQIVDAVLESRKSSPWVISKFQGPENRTVHLNDWSLSDYMSVKDQILPQFHQPNCVHRGPNGENRHNISPCQLSFDFDKVEKIRTEVAQLCSLAGIFPWASRCFGGGYARFDGNRVRVGWGYLDEPWYDTDLILQLCQETKIFCKAVRILQDGGLCCDKITILVNRVPGNVDMLSVLFDDIISYLINLQSLREADGAPRESETKLYDCASLAWEIMRRWIGPRELAPRLDDPSCQLHLCALVYQILAISLISYSQAHTSDFHPHLLKEPLQNIRLEGCAGHKHPKLTAELSYQKLACMDGLVGGRVLVLSLSVGSASRGDTIPAAEVSGHEDVDGSQASWFTGSIENIIDSWGPGVLISDPNPDVPYGENVRSVMIAGGVIAPSSVSDLSGIVYHWGRFDAPTHGDLTFNIRESLRIGAITVQSCCTLDPEKCRKVSEPYLDNLGTEADYWRLAERQMMLQSGQYVGLQVGSVYSKMKGRSLKMALLDMWGVMPDFRLLLQPWGLQISLCTGVARRVPLKALIEEPMFSNIDGISPKHWDDIKAGIRLAFNGTVDYISWTSGLQGPQRDCLIKVVTFFLEVLKDTGVDREGKLLRMLWPHETSLSHAISLKCSKSNLWARVLKDSPSCATFAAVTSKCLEAPSHQCHRNTAPIWTGQGALLSTAVSRVLLPGSLSTSGAAHWELKNGQQCWIEKAGSDIWVYTTKEPNSDTQLRVKINRFPKGLSIFRDWQVLRERQDAAFEAEEVVVFGTMA